MENFPLYIEHQHHTTLHARHEIQTHAEVNTSYGEPANYSVIQQ